MNARRSSSARAAVCMVGLWFALPQQGRAAEPELYAKEIRPFLERHCFDCHGEDTVKAGLRLDTLAPDFAVADKVRLWTRILDRMEAGEMPPKKKERPPVAA